jgi:hypothetical protein
MITQDELKKFIHYNPLTGVFTRLVSLHPRIPAGGVTGSTTRTGYVHIGVLGRSYPAARLAWLYMTGSFPKGQIDHINRLRNDNRFNNLRDVTQTQNNYNTGLYKNNTSGFKGVQKTKKGEYRAGARVDGVQTHIGTYATAEEASQAYLDFVAPYRGEYVSIELTLGSNQELPFKSKLKQGVI